MATNSDRKTVTLREVAQRAGVKPSAVSNWRKRNVGFPQPVGSAGREEHFDAAEVDAWLKATGRFKQASALARPRLSKTDEDLRAKVGMALLTLYATASAEDRRRLTRAPTEALMPEAVNLGLKYERSGRVPPPALTGVLDAGVDAGALGLDRVLADAADDPSQIPVMFEELAQRREGGTGGFRATMQTTPTLGRLVSQLLPGEARTIFDPASGEGSLLLACTRQRSGVRVAGTENNGVAFVVGVQRLLVNSVDADLRLGDALADDPFATEAFDAVVCEPPFGVRAEPTEDLTLAFRGAVGASPDMQWVLHCLLKVRRGGLAIIAQPAGVVGREGSDAILRAELLRRGNVHALIALPSGLAASSSTPLVLWLLTPHPETARRHDVLFVDLSWVPNKTQPDLDSLTQEIFPDVVADYQQWLRDPESFDGRAGMTAAVPVLDLLDASTPLSAQYWVARADRLRGRDLWPTRRDEALSLLDQALIELEVIEPPQDENIPPMLEGLEMGELPRFVPLVTLADAGRVELIRGEPVDKAELRSTGTPVLTAASFAESGQELMPAGYLPEPLASLTRPGDVIFLPRGKVRAAVDPDGGRSIAAPLMIVRPVQGDAGMSPRLLAALLTSPRVQSLATGTTIPSVSPKSVTLPRLDTRTAHAAASYLAHLDQFKAAALRVVDAVDEAVDTLIEGLETGAAAQQSDTKP